MNTATERLQDDLDLLKSAATLSMMLRTPEERVARFKRILQLTPPFSFFNELIDIDSGTALLRCDDLPQTKGDILNNVGLIGELRIPRGMGYVEWAKGSSEEIEGFTLNFLPMSFLEYNPQIEVGYRPSLVQLPIEDIRSCVPLS